MRNNNYAKDIRELQLAKADVHKMFNSYEKEKLKEKEVDTLFIAGTFGNYMNSENAK